jgi:hypothetical protein
MHIIREKISVDELKKMSEKMYNQLVKAVVDIEKKIMVVDADLHADEEQLLLENESDQKNLWGINLYPEKFGTEDFIEFDSMINIRPSWGNCTRGVENLDIQKSIIAVVNGLVSL